MSNEEPTQTNTPKWLTALTTLVGTGCIALLALWAFTLPLPEGNRAGSLAPRALMPCVMDQDGYLRGPLYGQISAELDWQGSNMRCDGMLRPDGAGIRLVFDEHLDEDAPGLLMVVGIADAILGEPVKDSPANITIINQSNGKFYSTGGETRCWTTFSNQLELIGTTEETWRVDGLIYCVGVLTELKGSGSVTLGELKFSGMFKPGIENYSD
jgi:hypothetical protein